ncbi:MAG: efflux RND transporter periplasmic adaptor subunit [bacterium]|nr:efflux RND transporter periplasmic adaptor subunit [bacterium]
MKLRGKKKWIIGLTVVVVAVIGGLNLIGNGEERTSVQADLAIVDDISEIVTASGRVQPKTKVDIASEVSAQILVIYVNEAEAVTVGQPLILLDTAQLRADLDQASYNLDEIEALRIAAKTTFERDKIKFNRQEKLYKQRLTSEDSFTDARFAAESAKANLDAMTAQVNTARARLEKAQDNLSKTTIVAPMEGVITFMSAEVGEIAQAQTAYTQGKTLMTISDLTIFEVEVDVDETEIVKLKLGQPVDIRVDALSEDSFAGTVVEIGNSATITGQGTDNYATNFKVKVKFNEANKSIRPGMSAAADIQTAHENEAILVPYASVVTREFDPDSLKKKTPVQSSGILAETVHAADLDDETDPEMDSSAARTSYKKKKKKIKKTGVFLIENGKAVFKELVTGIADDRNLVVLSGLNPGDTVISGTFQTLRKLTEGEMVTIDEASQKRMAEFSE